MSSLTRLLRRTRVITPLLAVAVVGATVT
ncbi:MAG: hypothetical protein QOF39_3334, partial [Frankiales bacterium]|nr:hypothetical protein [Frankiales bacterium]